MGLLSDVSRSAPVFNAPCSDPVFEFQLQASQHPVDVPFHS